MVHDARPRVVALIGVPGAGKSMVTKQLVEAGFSRVRFCDPARDMLVAGFGLGPDNIDGRGRDACHKRFGGCSVQFLMRTLTDEWGRKGVHSDLWSREWRRRVDALVAASPDKPVSVVVDDARRPGELAAVRSAGGVVIRITRPGYVPSNPFALSRVAELHADVEFINHNLDGLAAQTAAFLRGLAELEAA